MSIMLSLKRRRQVVQCLLSPHPGDSDLSTDRTAGETVGGGAMRPLGLSGHITWWIGMYSPFGAFSRRVAVKSQEER